MNATLDHCPCCGAPIANDLRWSRDARTLTGLGQVAMFNSQETTLFDLVWAANGNSVAIKSIIDALWGHDPNGGPDQAERCVAVYVYRINKKGRPLGVGLQNTYGGYRRALLAGRAKR